jgi:hypothetical protein
MVMEGLAWEMLDLIKDRTAKSMVLGRVANPRNMVLEGLGQEMVDLIKDRTAKSMVSGRVAKSKKYGPGRSGSGNGRFDKGLNSEIDGFWEGCQIQEICSWKVSVRKLSI